MANLDIFLIDYEIYKANPNWWLEIIEIFLKPGLKFKLSLEKGQTNILEKFSTYDSDSEISIGKNLIFLEGILNGEIIKDFKASYKVVNVGGIDYYSPFYSLEIVENYCSAHYGREIYLTRLVDEDFSKVIKVVRPLNEYLKIDVS